MTTMTMWARRAWRAVTAPFHRPRVHDLLKAALDDFDHLRLPAQQPYCTHADADWIAVKMGERFACGQNPRGSVCTTCLVRHLESCPTCQTRFRTEDW
jgi:hypothetical protein